MIVRTGITSFYTRNRLPVFSFTDFKQMAYACAIPCGYKITDLIASGVTPNFHTAVLESANDQVRLLGHSVYPIFAFAEPGKMYSCILTFRDMKEIAKTLNELFPDVTVATLEELSSPITKSDLEKLDRAEIRQVRYWKPKTIGELAFHWWD